MLPPFFGSGGAGESILRLHGDRDVWHALSAAGLAHMRTAHDEAVVMAALKRAIGREAKRQAA